MSRAFELNVSSQTDAFDCSPHSRASNSPCEISGVSAKRPRRRRQALMKRPAFRRKSGLPDFIWIIGLLNGIDEQMRAKSTRG
jgi:hypothetical protein